MSTYDPHAWTETAELTSNIELVVLGFLCLVLLAGFICIGLVVLAMLKSAVRAYREFWEKWDQQCDWHGDFQLDEETEREICDRQDLPHDAFKRWSEKDRNGP